MAKILYNLRWHHRAVQQCNIGPPLGTPLVVQSPLGRKKKGDTLSFELWIVREDSLCKRFCSWNKLPRRKRIHSGWGPRTQNCKGSIVDLFKILSWPPGQEEGPVMNSYVLVSPPNSALLPNRVQPLSFGRSFSQKEKNAHFWCPSHRALQASADFSREGRAPRKRVGEYFTLVLKHPGTPPLQLLLQFPHFPPGVKHHSWSLTDVEYIECFKQQNFNICLRKAWKLQHFYVLIIPFEMTVGPLHNDIYFKPSANKKFAHQICLNLTPMINAHKWDFWDPSQWDKMCFECQRIKFQ